MYTKYFLACLCVSQRKTDGPIRWLRKNCHKNRNLGNFLSKFRPTQVTAMSNVPTPMNMIIISSNKNPKGSSRYTRTLE